MRHLIKRSIHAGIIIAAIAGMHMTLAQVFSEKQAQSEVRFQLAAADYGLAAPQGYPAQQPQGYPAQQPQGYPAQQPQGYPAQQPQGYPAQQPQGYPAQQSQGYPAQQSQGYPAQESQGYPAQQSQGQEAVGDVNGNLKYVPRNYQAPSRFIVPTNPRPNQAAGQGSGSPQDSSGISPAGGLDNAPPSSSGSNSSGSTSSGSTSGSNDIGPLPEPPGPPPPSPTIGR